MPRGGARPGSGPKKGTKYRRRFTLTAQSGAAESKQTAAQRMAALRRQVALWTAGDMTPEEIAAVLGYDVDKLKAIFPRELAHGHAITKASLLARLDDAGNVAADKRLLDEIAPNAPLSAEKNPEGEGSEKPGAGRPRKIGKKEWAQAEADGAELGTAFEGLLGPINAPRKLQ